MSAEVQPPVPPPAEVCLRLAGPPRLQRGVRALPLERKAAAALAWLALRGPVQRERLARTLWPLSGEDAARNSLRQLIFKLKKAMAAAVIEGADTLHLADGVRLETAAAGALLLEGCEFADCPDFADWLAQARDAHRQRDQASRLAAAATAEQQGDLDRATSLARALLGDDPLLEAAHRQLIRALYLRGDRPAAVAAAAACERALHDGLGLAPAPETRQLIDSLHEQTPGDARAPAATTIPVVVLRPPRLIGRERERGLLAGARTRGQVLLLVGEPGLGKSRLLADAVDAAALAVAARPGDAGVPFATLARVLRQLLARQPPGQQTPLPAALRHVLPEFVSAGPSDASDAGTSPASPRLGLQRAVVALLAASGSAAQLVLDDLHFADDASIELLHSVLDEDLLAGWRWTLARRPAEGGAAATHLVEALADEGRLQTLTLQPLDPAQVAELLDSLALPGVSGAALAPALSRSTGGNPLFLLETLKLMLAHPASTQALPRPGSVGQLIERRLKQLSPGALALARVAALAGPDFSTDLAVQVLATPLMALTDAWAELEAAQVLRDQAFAHDLIFEATLASVPAAIRRHARRSIAEFLEPRAAEPARVAEHWLAADEPLRAAPLFEAAGRRAEAAARYAEAATLFDRTARCCEQAGQPARALAARLALADLLMEDSRSDAALALLHDLQQGALTVDVRIQVVMQRMRLLARLSRLDEAVDLARDVLADPVVAEDATPRRLAELRFALGSSLVHARRLPEALTELQALQPVFGADADAQQRSWFHHDYAVALLRSGEVAPAQAHLEQALAAAREVGRKRMIAGRLQLAAQLAEQAGHLIEAVERLDECLLLMVDAGGADDLSQFVHMQRGGLLVALGRYTEAIDSLQALQQTALTAPRRVQVGLTLARALGQLGQPERAQRCLHDAQVEPVNSADAADPWTRHLIAVTHTEFDWWSGHDPSAHLQLATELGPGLPLAEARLKLLHWRAWPDNINPAELAELQARWQTSGLHGHAAVATTLAARQAQRSGNAGAAATLAEQARTALRRAMPPDLYRPWLCLQIADAAADADPALARRALQDGVDWVQSVATFHVPLACRSSFLQRNPINRALLARVQGHA